jgi:nucleotide-binding universal stress UspA family protein
VAHGDSERGESESAEPWREFQPGEFELGTDGPSAILVGVDDTVTAARAAWYAAGLARRQRARMIVVHVMPTPMVLAPNPAAVSVVAAEAQAHEEVAADMRARAEEVARELGISITFIAAHGDPYTEIRRIAKEMRADAIIVGASAKAGHRLIGSLAVRLVRAGQWPVTVVP